jgi:hypothetical protein
MSASHHRTVQTEGWFLIYDIKDQCAICKHVVVDKRMACCDYNKQSFPAAHNCALFKWDEVVE